MNTRLYVLVSLLSAVLSWQFTLTVGELSLVPNDVHEPTCWVDKPSFPKRLLPFSFKDGIGIRKYQLYVPLEVEDNHSLEIWIVIHGTGGQHTPKFFDDTDLHNPHYRHIQRAAAISSNRRNRPLMLFSFQWPADWFNADTIRKNAAKYLKDMLQVLKGNVTLLGHSHGCNVANYLSRIVPAQKPLELLVHFACPVRKEDCYQPLYYKKLIYFYSDFDLASFQGDFVTILGRMNEDALLEKALMSVGAVALTVLVEQLIKANTDSQETVVFTEKARTVILILAILVMTVSIVQLAEGTNQFVLDECKQNLGINVSINGKKPGHSEIMDVIALLPEITDELEDICKEGAIASGYFDLSIHDKSIALLLNDFVEQVQNIPLFVQ